MPKRGLTVGDLIKAQAVELSYPDVRATRNESLPSGYRHVRRRKILGSGQSLFERASVALLTWEMHRHAGLDVVASDLRAAPGVVVVLRLRRWFPLVTAPCRVIYTMNERSRRGFAYGTLKGHPEMGEEAFLLTRDANGVVNFEIRAFSRPAGLLTKLGGPLARALQDRITDRYIKALAALSAR